LIPQNLFLTLTVVIFGYETGFAYYPF